MKEELKQDGGLRSHPLICYASLPKTKVVNLYAGIGGNRKLWENVEVTAVEMNPEIAEVYREFFPDDEVIIGDAHEYLLHNYRRFDFIWSSFPCQTHSKIREMGMKLEGKGKTTPKYPDMRLYEEIIFLKHIAGYYGIKYTVENVRPYYEPLIPAQKIGRHLFWANFQIPEIKIEPDIHEFGTNKIWQEIKGFDLTGKTFKTAKKGQVLRNCVKPELGLHVFEAMLRA